MKPLESLAFHERSRLLAYGTITLADGRILMKLAEHDYIVRSEDGDLHFPWWGDVENYIAFHGATFHSIVVDSEEAKSERIARQLQRKQEQ